MVAKDCIALNGMLSYLPHALALSASSPFWQGNDTGLASSRVTVYETRRGFRRPSRWSPLTLIARAAGTRRPERRPG